MAQEAVFGLCAIDFLCPSLDSFGLIQLRCRMAHVRAIYTGNRDMIIKGKKKKNSYCSLTVHEKGIKFYSKKIWYVQYQIKVFFLNALFNFTVDEDAVTGHIRVRPKHMKWIH